MKLLTKNPVALVKATVKTPKTSFYKPWNVYTTHLPLVNKKQLT